MNLTLIPNAAALFFKLWSVRVALLNGILAVGYALLPQVQAILSPETFALMTALLNGINMLVRMLAQKDLPGETPSTGSGTGGAY